MDAQQKSLATIERLKAELAQAVSQLPPALQSEDAGLLVDCLATVFEEGDSRQLPKRPRKEDSAPPFWEVFAKALTESSDEEGQVELDAAEAAAAHIEAEIREAETSWQPVRDPFLCSGLCRGDDDDNLKLVSCNACHRTVLAHRYLAHLSHCQVPSPAPSSVSGKAASKNGRAASLGPAGLARPKKRPRSVPLGKSNLSNVSTLPRQAVSSAVCLPVQATEAAADAELQDAAVPPAAELKFHVRNKRTEQPRKVRRIQELPWRSPEAAPTIQQMSGSQREATQQDVDCMTNAQAEAPLHVPKTTYNLQHRHPSSVQAINQAPSIAPHRQGQQPFDYSVRPMSGPATAQQKLQIQRSSSGVQPQNQMFRPQRLPPAYQPSAQRAANPTASSLPSLGLPASSHRSTVTSAQPLDSLRYSQGSARPPSAPANPRPANFYPSSAIPAARPQGNYIHVTNAQPKIQTTSQPGAEILQNRAPQSNSSIRPAYPSTATHSLPRPAATHQPALQNGRQIYGQAQGYGLSHSTGQQWPQAISMAKGNVMIRPSTARSVPLHLERARASNAAYNQPPTAQFVSRPQFQNIEAPSFRVSDFSYPARPPLGQSPAASQGLYGSNNSISRQGTAQQLQSRPSSGQAGQGYGNTSLSINSGARLVQSGNTLQQSQIPGLGSLTGQSYAPAPAWPTGPQTAGTVSRYPVSMQSRNTSALTSKAADSQPLSGQNGRVAGFGLPDTQGFGNSIPGLGLPIEKPRAPVKEAVLPKESLLDAIDPEDSLLYTTPLNGYYREDWRLNSDDKEDWRSPRTQHVHS